MYQLLTEVDEQQISTFLELFLMDSLSFLFFLEIEGLSSVLLTLLLSLLKTLLPLLNQTFLELLEFFLGT